jgi:hypothetical protein
MRWPAVAAVLVAVLFAGCVHHHERPNRLGFHGCIEGTEPPPLELVWHQLPNAGSTVELAGSAATLTVRNNTEVDLDVVVSVGGALDDLRRSFELPALTVAAGSEVDTEVDLAKFETDLAAFELSARVVAKGSVRSGGEVLDLVYSPHVYFHVADEKVLVYRRGALVERFKAGDPGGRAGRLRKWAARRGLRIAGVGRLGSGLELTDDDGGPQEGVVVP